MKKHILNAAGAIGTVVGVSSIISLIDTSMEAGWSPLIRKAIDFYEKQKLIILEPIVPFAEKFADKIAGLFEWNLDLQPTWSDVFVLMALYFGSRARSYWAAGLKRRATFRIAWGFVVSLLFSVLAGLVPPGGAFSSISMMLIVLAGLFIFDLADATWSATFRRAEGLSWLSDFIRYLWFSMPTILLGILFVGVSWLLFPEPLPDYIVHPGSLLLLFYTFILAFYWLFRGLQSSLTNTNRSGTGLEKLLASSNTRIAILMLGSLGGAALVVAFGAGHP
jgi:hypothetical protein